MIPTDKEEKIRAFVEASMISASLALDAIEAGQFGLNEEQSKLMKDVTQKYKEAGEALLAVNAIIEELPPIQRADWSNQDSTFGMK